MKQVTKFILESNYNAKNAILFSNIIAGFVLINIFSILPDIFSLYSKFGFFNNEFNKHSIPKHLFIIDDLCNFFLSLGIKYEFAFITIFLIYILSLISILFNYARLFFSFVIVFLHTVFINSGEFICYGADYMISFLLYINIFLSMGNYVSDENFNKIYSFTIRLMQIQLCVIYFFGGFGKSLGFDFYTGDAIWLSLNNYMNENILNIISKYTPKYVYQILSIHVLLIELFYPILVYFKKTRKWVIIDILILHVGISIMMGLHTFSLVMIIFNIMAFYPERMAKIYKLVIDKLIMFFNNKKLVKQ